MRSAGNASIFSIRVLLSAGISVPSTRLLVAFYQHTPPLPMPRPVSRHRAREGADRWSGDIRSFLGCAGLFGKNVLARLTGPGLAANDLARTCSAYPRLRLSRSKAWMAGTRPAKTKLGTRGPSLYRLEIFPGQPCDSCGQAASLIWRAGMRRSVR